MLRLMIATTTLVMAACHADAERACTNMSHNERREMYAIVQQPPADTTRVTYHYIECYSEAGSR
jgi:Spy/CpxP family protein refolding chaperone